MLGAIKVPYDEDALRKLALYDQLLEACKAAIAGRLSDHKAHIEARKLARAVVAEAEKCHV